MTSTLRDNDINRYFTHLDFLLMPQNKDNPLLGSLAAHFELNILSINFIYFIDLSMDYISHNNLVIKSLIRRLTIRINPV